MKERSYVVVHLFIFRFSYCERMYLRMYALYVLYHAEKHKVHFGTYEIHVLFSREGVGVYTFPNRRICPNFWE